MVLKIKIVPKITKQEISRNFKENTQKTTKIKRNKAIKPHKARLK
jgi:hypothetical protein